MKTNLKCKNSEASTSEFSKFLFCKNTIGKQKDKQKDSKHTSKGWLFCMLIKQLHLKTKAVFF